MKHKLIILRYLMNCICKVYRKSRSKKEKKKKKKIIKKRSRNKKRRRREKFK